MDALLERLEERIGLTRADLVGVAIALVGCAVATLVAVRLPLVPVTATDALEPTPSAAAAVPGGAPLFVHVAGAVAAPGVVELVTGDRVADAIAAAGGALPDASMASLNLARPLVDGEQVVVPTEVEAAAAPTPAADDARLPDGRLDLNRATAADLEELPGVGPVLAARILAHREEHGPFTEPVELRAVSGIGEATWASLRDQVGVR